MTSTAADVDVRGPRRLGGSLLVALVVVVVDQLTKHWAINALDDRDIDLVWTLRLNLHFNRGMAFSRGENLGPVIGVVALLVVVALLLSVRRRPGRTTSFAVGLVIGGAVGNVIDRLFRDEGWFRGAVVDFIDLQWWPIFNVADAAIVVGGVLLVLGSLRQPAVDRSADGREVEASGAEMHGDSHADELDSSDPARADAAAGDDRTDRDS